MRLAASLAPRSARSALVSPARDAEHIEAGMHRMMVGSRDESPETSFGLRRKFRVAETWYAWRSIVWRGITSDVSSWGRRSVMEETDLGGLTELRRYAMRNEMGITGDEG